LETLLQQPVILWFLAGLVMLLLELAVPGLIIIFFGVGAWVAAFACLFFDIGINVQLFIFLFSSVLSLLLLRRWALKRFSDKHSAEKTGSGNIEEDYIGKKALAMQNLLPGHTGKVDFRGTIWDAISSLPVAEGQEVLITGYKSIQLIVEPIN
jgi:inner membrane protein